MSDNSFELDVQQRAAIEMCTDMQKRIVSVTGPAGSGKTTIIRRAYDRLTGMGYRVVLAAPTGKAARRIKEATGIPAITVHKLLEYGRPGERDEETGKPLDPTLPKRHRGAPLDQQVVIVDEYAMINYELHNNLMAAMPSGGVVRAFGDVNQLPPIEPYRITNKSGGIEPTPFEKLLNRTADSVRLEKVYRQTEDSHILEAADRIRKGHTPVLNTDLGDFYIKLTDRPIEILKQWIKDKPQFGEINCQVISPSKKSWVGTHQLNDILRNILNPNPVQTVELPRHKWDKERVIVGVGDKVVCTENSYDLRDYFERYTEWDNEMRPMMHSYIPCPDNKQMLNGETGIVKHIYPDGALDIDFGDRIVEVPALMHEYWGARDTIIEVCPLRSIDLAFALTTHKCQGSEFDQVIYLMNKSMFYTLSRQNFYTAVTRARTRVDILTDQRGLSTSLNKVSK